jgi:hypothetical protein
MKLDRREFIASAASAAALGAFGDVIGKSRQQPEFMWSYLAHFGVNSWRDLPLEKQDPSLGENFLTRCCANHVRFDEASWLRISDALSKAGCNQIIIDLAEIVVYPSHPELAVEGSWSVEKLRSELARLRGMGFEVVPKMNFSACHDTWLKEYHRMLSTEKYYRVCEDLIRDAVEIFDHPRLLHIGYDEETAKDQHNYLYAVCRQGDLWWHDLLFLAKIVESAGARPWMWSDYIWRHKDEFLSRMPKSILQSNWYYGQNFNVAEMGERSRYVEAYEWLDKAGFDQVPTGSNYSCDTNFADTVKFCGDKCSKDLIKGFMMAPWTRTFASHEEKAMQAIAQMGETIRQWKA